MIRVHVDLDSARGPARDKRLGTLEVVNDATGHAGAGQGSKAPALRS
jgi:hypothetical protein